MPCAAGAAFSAGAVHAELEFIDLWTHPSQTHPFLSRAKLLGHENLDGFVLEESVRGSGKVNRVFGAELEGLLKTRTSLGVTLLVVATGTLKNLAGLSAGG